LIHRLPALPYEFGALEPHIDARTMELHHGRHHAAYVASLNTAVAEYPELAERSAAWLLLNLGKIPEGARAWVRTSAGGHVNHSLFWRAMTPKGRGEPSGRLADAIARDFGSVEDFKSQFDTAGALLVGSGWVWLVRAQQNGGRLRVVTTLANGNPMMEDHFPLLVNDVWEHAYYLKHENRRPDYLRGWWNLVDWVEVARRFARSDHNSRERWAVDGDLLLEAA
jgi:Fe-Mn family superoxide dismutase